MGKQVDKECEDYKLRKLLTNYLQTIANGLQRNVIKEEGKKDYLNFCLIDSVIVWSLRAHGLPIHSSPFPPLENSEYTWTLSCKGLQNPAGNGVGEGK